MSMFFRWAPGASGRTIVYFPRLFAYSSTNTNASKTQLHESIEAVHQVHNLGLNLELDHCCLSLTRNSAHDPN